MFPLPNAMAGELLLADVGEGLASGGVVVIVCRVVPVFSPVEVAFGGGGFSVGLTPGAALAAWAPVASLKGASCGGPMEEGGGLAGVGGGGKMVLG